jgi:hypothetical protein
MLHRTRVSRVSYPRPLDKRVTAAVVAAGGTGYAADDVINLANGVVLTVATLTGDAVATVTITNAGRVNGADPTNPQAQVSTDGSGTGATFTLTWTVEAVTSTAYTIGDLIGNSQVAALVTPIVFPVSGSLADGRGFGGRIRQASLTINAASGTVVLPKFDLLLFRAAPTLPADNAALAVPMASFKDLIAVVPFSETAFRNKAGAVTASDTYGWQSVALTGTPGFQASSLYGVMQAQNAWAPGAVAYDFHWALDLELD